MTRREALAAALFLGACVLITAGAFVVKLAAGLITAGALLAVWTFACVLPEAAALAEDLGDLDLGDLDTDDLEGPA
jgi:ABC-type transport system involved in cytochrome c biogenesis permease component